MMLRRSAAAASSISRSARRVRAPRSASIAARAPSASAARGERAPPSLPPAEPSRSGRAAAVSTVAAREPSSSGAGRGAFFVDKDPGRNRRMVGRQRPSRRWVSLVAASSPPEDEDEEEAPPGLPPDVEACLPDFFGEPVTFLRLDPLSSSDDELSSSPSANVPTSLTPTAAVQSLDEFLLCVTTRGSSSDDGGVADGVEVRAAHSSALSWGALFRRALARPDAPMLTVAAVAPALVQGGGSAYLRWADARLASAGGSPSLTELARSAAALSARPSLTPRERRHVRALRRLLDDDLPGAASEYLALLRAAPGDALALHLLLDASSALGDASLAFSGAGCVASYWSDRYSSPGHALATSLVAAGLAGAGETQEAEALADASLRRDADGAGGVAGHALGLCYEAEGRSSEGMSLLCGYDGARRYEGCGFLAWDARMAGMGAAFALDRDGAGADRVAERMYDNGYGRVIGYGDAGGGAERRVPRKAAGMVRQMAAGGRGFFKSLFGGSGGSGSGSQGDERPSDEPTEDSANDGERPQPAVPPTVEDVLAFLPPTPQFLTEATMLLLRLTLSGSIEASDQRWDELRLAWEEAIDAHGGREGLQTPARVASALLLGEDDDDDNVVNDEENGDRVSAKLAEAGRLLGRLLRLGRGGAAVRTESNEREACGRIVRLLTEARDGIASPVDADADADDADGAEQLRPVRPLHRDLSGCNRLLRPLSEHALVRCALRSTDPADLAAARASCSEAVALRPNCPEVWWRYGEVLDALGDVVAAEGARSVSVSLGSGEGGHFRD